MLTTTAPALVEGFPAESRGSKGRWMRKAGSGRFVIGTRRSALAQFAHLMVFELNEAGAPQEGTLAAIDPTTVGNLSSAFQLETTGSRLMHFASDVVVVLSVSGMFATIAYEQELLAPRSFQGWGDNSVAISPQNSVVAIVDDAFYEYRLQALAVNAGSIVEGDLSLDRLISATDYLLESCGTHVGNAGEMVWMLRTERYGPYSTQMVFVRAKCDGGFVAVHPAVGLLEPDGYPMAMAADPSGSRFAALWLDPSTDEAMMAFGRLEGESSLVFGTTISLGFSGNGWGKGAMVWQPGTDQVLIAASDLDAGKLVLLAVSCSELSAVVDPDGPVELEIESSWSGCMEWDEDSGRAILAFFGDGGPVTPQLNKPYIMTIVGDIPPPVAFWTNHTKQREEIPEG